MTEKVDSLWTVWNTPAPKTKKISDALPWFDKAYALLKIYARQRRKTGKLFTNEDFMAWALKNGLSEPSYGQVGALFKTCRNDGIIFTDGQTKNSHAPKRHGRRVLVWC